MFVNPKNWALNSYTPASETDFIADSGTSGTVVQSIVISMVPTGSPLVTSADVRLVITDESNVALFELLPEVELDAAGGPIVLDLRSIALVAGQKNRAQA